MTEFPNKVAAKEKIQAKTINNIIDCLKGPNNFSDNIDYRQTESGNIASLPFNYPEEIKDLKFPFLYCRLGYDSYDYKRFVQVFLGINIDYAKSLLRLNNQNVVNLYLIKDQTKTEITNTNFEINGEGRIYDGFITVLKYDANSYLQNNIYVHITNIKDDDNKTPIAIISTDKDLDNLQQYFDNKLEYVADGVCIYSEIANKLNYVGDQRLGNIPKQLHVGMINIGEISSSVYTDTDILANQKSIQTKKNYIQLYKFDDLSSATEALSTDQVLVRRQKDDQTYVEYVDLSAISSGNLSGNYWLQGGDYYDCYGKSIGCAIKENEDDLYPVYHKMIDLENETFHSKEMNNPTWRFESNLSCDHSIKTKRFEIYNDNNELVGIIMNDGLMSFLGDIHLSSSNPSITLAGDTLAPQTITPSWIDDVNTRLNQAYTYGRDWNTQKSGIFNRIYELEQRVAALGG